MNIGCAWRRPHLLTAESVRMVAMGDLMFFRSHTLTVRSSLPETTLSPAVNTAEVTVLKDTEDTLVESCSMCVDL